MVTKTADKMSSDMDDEEFARKLQEEFDAESKKQAPVPSTEIKKSSSFDDLLKKQV